MRQRRLLHFFLPLILLATIGGPAIAETTSKRTYLKLIEIQKLAAGERYDEALERLHRLVADTKDKRYDHIVANQNLARISVAAGQVDKARQVLKSTLAISGIKQYPDIYADLSLFNGQLLLHDQQYELARQALEEWLELAKEPQDSQIFTLSYANYMAHRLPRAQELIERAIQGALHTGVPDAWYRVYYQILFEREQYNQAEAILHDLIRRDIANDVYWRMLANHYLHLEKGSDSLAVLAVAHLQELLKKPEELKQLASMYGYLDIPEKAARLLEQWIADDIIEGDADTLRRLADLWLMARDQDKAKDYLSQVLAVKPTGAAFELLGGLYFEEENWELAHQTFSRALASGKLKDPGRIHLMAGVCALRAGMDKPARQSLSKALEYVPRHRPC